jgi:hypothetical protein
MVKKTKKPPVKNGKKKTVTQKQKQSVVVNINTVNPRVRQPVKQSKPKQYPQYITTYPVFMDSPPSLPIIYNRPEHVVAQKLDLPKVNLASPIKVQEPVVAQQLYLPKVNLAVDSTPFVFKTPVKTPVKKAPVKKTPVRKNRPSRIPVAVNNDEPLGKIVMIRRNKKTPIEPTVNMTDVYDVPDYIPDSTSKNYEKLTPTERNNLLNFKDEMNLKLASNLDNDLRQEAVKNAKAKDDAKSKKFSYIR